jgi:hypothetical protein
MGRPTSSAGAAQKRLNNDPLLSPRKRIQRDLAELQTLQLRVAELNVQIAKDSAEATVAACSLPLDQKPSNTAAQGQRLGGSSLFPLASFRVIVLLCYYLRSHNDRLCSRCGLFIGPDPKFDRCIAIDGVPNFTYTRPTGEPEKDWGEGR